MNSFRKYWFSKITKLEAFQDKPKINDETQIPKIPQHPKKIDSTDSSIRSPFLKIKPLNSSLDIPYEAYKIKNAVEFQDPIDSKYLQIALVGAPNAGKSSLFNKLVEDDISAVSKKAHTTADAIQGYYTNINLSTQMKFFDTPGLYRLSKNKSYFENKPWKSISDCNIILFIADAVKTFDDPSKEVLRRLQKIQSSADLKKKIDQLNTNEKEFESKFESYINEVSSPQDSQPLSENCVLVLNKIDLCSNKRRLHNLMEEIEGTMKFQKTFFTSAVTGYGISELKNYLIDQAPRGKWEVHPSKKSDMNEIAKVLEVVKSALYERFYYEVPHHTGMEVEEFVINSDKTIKIGVKLTVTTSHLARMIVGHNGRNLKFMQDMIISNLAQKYGIKFIVKFRVAIDEKSLTHKNTDVEYIIPPEYGTNKVKNEIDLAKFEQEKMGIEEMNHELNNFLENAKAKQQVNMEKNLPDNKHKKMILKKKPEKIASLQQ